MRDAGEDFLLLDVRQPKEHDTARIPGSMLVPLGDLPKRIEELREHADKNNLTIAQVILANEMSIAGRSQEEIYAFIDKITGAMVAIVKSGLKAPEGERLPGPIKLQSKASTVFKRAQDESFQSDRGIGLLSAYALAGSEENGRGHLVAQ